MSRGATINNQVSEQVRKDTILRPRTWLRQIRLWKARFQPHFRSVAPNRVPTGQEILLRQEHGDFSGAEKRRFGVEFVEPMLDQDFMLVGRSRLVVEVRSG